MGSRCSACHEYVLAVGLIGAGPRGQLSWRISETTLTSYESTDDSRSALVGHRDNQLWLVSHEFVDRKPSTGPGVVVVNDNDPMM